MLSLSFERENCEPEKLKIENFWPKHCKKILMGTNEKKRDFSMMEERIHICAKYNILFFVKVYVVAKNDLIIRNFFIMR
jgi:hypothetical protein